MRHDPVLRRAFMVGFVAPDALVAIALALQLWLMADLPAEVVTHWGSEGPDGYGPAWTYPVLTLAVGLGLPALMMAFTLPSIRRGERSPMLRLMPAIGVGFTALIATISTGSLLVQRGLEDGDQPSIGGVVVASYVVAVLIGLLGWAVQPRQELAQPSRQAVGPMPVAPSEKVVWLGRAEAGATLMAILIAVSIVLAGAAVWMWLAGDDVAAWILTGVVLLVALLTSASTVFRVRTDLDGLEARSALGWPRFSIPVEDIADVSVVDVSGLAEFGGWGIRFAPGATGVILRNGQALQVARRSGRRFVITVDDPQTAASVLAAAAQKAAHADQD